MKLENMHGDMSCWREVEFALNCTYIVPDQVSDPSFNLPKAMTSIPRNLTFEYGADNEVRAQPTIPLISQWRTLVLPCTCLRAPASTVHPEPSDLKNMKTMLHNNLLGHLHQKQKIC